MESAPSIEQQFLKKLTDIIDVNLHNEQFGVNELATELGMSRITLHRKVKSTVKKSVSEFIRETRLKRSYELLQQKTGTVSEIAYQVGFGSVTYFVKCFHDYFGYPPGEVLKNDFELLHEKPVAASQTKSIFHERLVSLTVLLALITLVISVLYFAQISTNKGIEKSIAVLPFVNDTPTSSNDYLEGLREEIINKLALIADLKVVSRTSADTYRNCDKALKTIAKELKVNYVLEGSAQTVSGKTRIRLQLIEAATDDHLWSKPFERELHDENIFEVQQEIAGLVSKYLKAKITPEEKAQIAKPDTENKIAYSFYLQGMNYYNIYDKERKLEPLKKSIVLFHQAIQHDSLYSRAYYNLAWALFEESRFGSSQQKRDSILLMLNRAIEINPLFSEAYSLKGFLSQSNFKEASQAFKMAIRTGPDKPEGYHQFGNFCCNIGEYANTIKYSLKSIEVCKEPIVHDWTFINLNVALNLVGFFDLAEKYRNEYMVQHNNQLIYYNMQQFEAVMKQEYAEAIKYGVLALQTDSADLTSLDFLGQSYLFTRNFERALYFYQKYFESLKKQPYQPEFQTEYDFLLYNNQHSNGIGQDIFPLMHITFLYGITGNKTNYETHLKALLDNLKLHEEHNSMWEQLKMTAFEKGCIYASLNQNEKAIESLKRLTTGKVNPVWMANYLEDNPMLDGLHNNPDYPVILEKLHNNYQKERKKAQLVLVENDLISLQ